MTQRLRGALRLLVLALCAAGGGPSFAVESVGRVEFSLPSSGWQEVLAWEHPMIYMDSSQISLFTKVYLLAGEGPRPRAVLVVTSTGGSKGGRTSWVTEVCPDSRPRYFSNDFGSNNLTRVRECIVVNPGFVADKFWKSDDPVWLGLQKAGVQMPPSAYSMRAVVGIQGGALIRVHLMTDKRFAGLRGKTPASPDLHGVAPALVAWVEALHEEMRAAATSLGGTMAIPAIEFEPN